MNNDTPNPIAAALAVAAAKASSLPMSKIQRITPDCQPVFPCWLWNHTGNFTVSRKPNWAYFVELPHERAMMNCSHFHPDQPEPPTERPEEVDFDKITREAIDQFKPHPTIPELAAKCAPKITEYLRREYNAGYTFDEQELAAVITRTFEEGRFGQVKASDLNDPRRVPVESGAATDNTSALSTRSTPAGAPPDDDPIDLSTPDVVRSTVIIAAPQPPEVKAACERLRGSLNVPTSRPWVPAHCVDLATLLAWAEGGRK